MDAMRHKLRSQRVQNEILKMILSLLSWTTSTEVRQLANLDILKVEFASQCAKYGER